MLKKNNDTSKKQSSLFPSVKRILKNRVEENIYSLRLELETNKEDCKDKLSRILQEAEKYTYKDPDRAWHYIHLFREYKIKYYMDTKNLKDEADMLRIETSEKISGWRKTQIYKLIGSPEKHTDPEKPNDIVSLESLVSAIQVRNDFYNTQSIRLLLRRESLNSLAFTLIFILGAFVILSYQLDLFTGHQAPAAILFGALGASFSLAYTLTFTPLHAKIPDQIGGFFVTIIRLAIGGTAALVVLVLLHSTMLENFFNDDWLYNEHGYLVLAFLSGFSERWIVKVLDTVSSDESEKKKNHGKEK